MSLSLILVSGITLLVIIFFVSRKKRPQKFPPGPSPIPILGNLLQAGSEPHKGFIKIGKKYGGIFGFDYATYSAVVINDLKIMKRWLNDPAFAGRPKFDAFLDRFGPGSTYGRGVISSELQHWTEQRRFVIKNLRDFGFGKSSMQEVIKEEIEDFIETLRKNSGKPISTRGLFTPAVLNSLWRIVTGARTPQSDPKLKRLLEYLGSSLSQSITFVFIFPFVGKHFPKLIGYDKILKLFKPLFEFIREPLLEHKASYTPGQPRDLMDSFCEELATTTDPNSSFYKDEGERNANASLEDLFIAGSETTSTTLTWVSLILALYPQVQDKMYTEIVNVIGTSRLPDLNDRSTMPFTECFIMEVLRISSVFPLSVFHSTTEDTNIDGFFIPKETIITPNLYAVLHSEEIWGDPEIFRPERFLLPDASVNRQHEAFLPFSYGKRACIGEKLAKDTLFLFTTTLCQQFQLATDPTQPTPTLGTKATIVLSPCPHEIIFSNRL